MNAEATRIRTILASTEGRANPTLAQHLAFETNDTAEGCIETLQVAAAQAIASKPNHGWEEAVAATNAARGIDNATKPDASDASHGWGEAVAATNTNRR